ncbi:MAG: hypothetical protein PHT78_08760 [Desulfitobacteriaceae bacterium]|nr:hypothetical protein [Desulfitobacteriaceae bacterium]
MFDSGSYFFIIISLSGGLLALLSAVGIFVSLIIQRRVERLQDILEELLDLSYANEFNTSTKIQNLIYKYQMQYNLPVKPIKSVLAYITLTIVFTILFWAWLLFLIFKPPFKWNSLVYLFPMVAITAIMIFYRHLIKSAVNPIGHHMFKSIIPAPRFLRSIAFLSSHINVAAANIISQARPLPVIREKAPNVRSVVLKEEIPFDDYHYYFSLYHEEEIFFIGFGHMKIDLDDDPITGKPRPTARNLNIPLGELDLNSNKNILEAVFLVFPKGEKYPVQFKFILEKESRVYCAPQPPAVSLNHLITYCFDNNHLRIISNQAGRIFSFIPKIIPADSTRWYKTSMQDHPLKENSIPYED